MAGGPGQKPSTIAAVSIAKTLVHGPLGRIVALPSRAATVARYNRTVLSTSFRWLATSREHTNFTYDLTQLNESYLAWWVATIAAQSVETARECIAEAVRDDQLREHIAIATLRSPRRSLADASARFGRRLGWYALVRLLRPAHVVETGTDKGLGACILAAALLRNGTGQLTTIDVNDASGYLIGGDYATVTTALIGDSIKHLARLRVPIDLLIHDSLHTFEHETAEYETARLNPGALIISDNAHRTDALAVWAERTGRAFSFFAEEPAQHWFPGAGIGAAWDRSLRSH